MAMTERKVIDCRKAGKASGCTLSIAGTEQEVLDAAALHAIQVHGMSDTPQLKDQLRQFLEPADAWPEVA